jgi:hypothetical protein
MTEIIQYEIDQEERAELERLRIAGGFDSIEDLFNSALTVTKWALKHAEQGHMIAVVDEKKQTYTELKMPFLEYVSKKHTVQ